MPSLKDRVTAFLNPPKVKTVEKDGIMQLYVKATDSAPWIPSQVGFGPGEPLRPLAGDEPIRREDYLVGRNMLFTPRATEPRAVTYAQLRELSRVEPILRSVIEKRKDEMKGLGWSISVKKDNKGIRKYEDAVKRTTDFFTFPDRDSKFDDWLGMLLEDIFVIDAPTLFRNRSRGGELLSLDIIDGSTVLLLVDDKGRLPQPPNPAYEQIIHGAPRTWWTKDELLYFPYNRASDGVYGFSHVESIILYVNIALRRDISFLEWFKSGNIPPALATVPESWTPQQIVQAQTLFDDRLSGNLAERSKLTLVPFGNVTEIKQLTFDGQFDEWLARIECGRFGVNPNAYVKMMNRATSESVEEASTEESLVPMMNHLKAILDQVIQKDMGRPYLEFIWQESQAHYSKEQADIDEKFVQIGAMTLDQMLEQRGLEPIENGLGSHHLIWAPGGPPTLLEEIVNPPKAPPPQLQMVQNPFQPKPGELPAGQQPKQLTAPLREDGTPSTKDLEAWERFALNRIGKKTRPFETSLPAETVAYINKCLATASTAAEVKAVFAEAKDVKKKLTPLRTSKHREEALRHNLFTYFSRLGHHVESASKAVPDWKKIVSDAVDSLDVTLLGLLSSELTDTYQEGANHIYIQLAMYGADPTSTLTSPADMAVTWAKEHCAQLVTHIDDTTKERIAEIISQGLDQSLPTNAIARNIRDEFARMGVPDEMSNSRAATIARTEINNALRDSGVDASREAGAEGQEWDCQPDACDDCLENEAMGVISIDDDFPDTHPNCQCGISPVWRIEQ